MSSSAPSSSNSDVIDPELEELMPNFHPLPVDENPNEEEVDGPVFAQFQNFQNGDHTWMHNISSDAAVGSFLVDFYFIFAGLFAHGLIFIRKLQAVQSMYVNQSKIRVVDDETGEEYECEVRDKGNWTEKYVRSGWVDFVREKELKHGDLLFFTIDNPPHKLFVLVIRGGS
ncbi:putative transcription factor B3-Domain family [Medicago truncatula]|uniref:Putative transcription factor B3-Domain family n=1 Tax=Medicago truncatula TaxID=3880 RepID=A0A396H8N5_MEDTR|nr:putative transcription factor B3-Domain family [Medicago truncatula]